MFNEASLEAWKPLARRRMVKQLSVLVACEKVQGITRIRFSLHKHGSSSFALD